MSAPGQPQVSVVVPVKDQVVHLGELLDALEQQTFDDFETIIVDDASRDGSGEMAAARARSGSSLRVVTLTEPAGAVAARLAGVEIARGAVLAFTDSDCAPAPRWLEAAVSAIEDGADLVAGPTRPARAVGPLERSMHVERDHGLYPTCNLVCRRDAYERAGGFRDATGQLGFRVGRRARGLGFGEDTLLAWTIRRQGPVAFARDAVVVHQVLPLDPRSAVSRAWQAGGFPALVRAVPELRSTLLRGRVRLGRRAQGRWLAGVAAALARRPGLAAVLLAGWAAHHARQLDRADPRWPVQLAVVLVVDSVTEVALVTGSIEARSLVI